MVRSLLSLLVLVAGVLPATAADDPVELELTALVGDVSAVLDKLGHKAVRLGKFTGDGDIPSNFGPEIVRVLGVEFGKKSVKIDKDAEIEMKGEYAPATADPQLPQAKMMFIRVNARLVNTKTRLELANLPTLSRAIYGNDALGRAFAPTVSLPPAADLKTRNEEIKKAVEKPTTHLAQTKVKSSAGSPFAIEVLVPTSANAADPVVGVPVRDKDGCAFVDLHKTRTYRVKIHNGADFDVAVRLSVDGLDQYTFADKEFRGPDGRPKFQYLVVPRGKSAVIRGWFRNLKTADSFLVTEYAKSASAEVNGPQGDIGQIAVQIHAAWDTEEELRKESAKDTATGRGDPVDVNLKVVKRHIGALRDQVSVRYGK